MCLELPFVNSASVLGMSGVFDNGLLVEFYWLLMAMAAVVAFPFWRRWYSSSAKRTYGLSSFLLCGSCDLGGRVV